MMDGPTDQETLTQKALEGAGNFAVEHPKTATGVGLAGAWLGVGALRSGTRWVTNPFGSYREMQMRNGIKATKKATNEILRRLEKQEADQALRQAEQKAASQAERTVAQQVERTAVQQGEKVAAQQVEETAAKGLLRRGLTRLMGRGATSLAENTVAATTEAAATDTAAAVTTETVVAGSTAAVAETTAATAAVVDTTLSTMAAGGAGALMEGGGAFALANFWNPVGWAVGGTVLLVAGGAVGYHYWSKHKDGIAHNDGFASADEEKDAKAAGFQNSTELHFVDEQIRKAGMGTSLLDYAQKGGHKTLEDFAKVANHGQQMSGTDYAKAWGYKPDWQAIKFQQYRQPPNEDAWKKDSWLDKQAVQDGYAGGIQEAHWAASLGFVNSTDFHQVYEAAKKFEQGKQHGNPQDALREYLETFKGPQGIPWGSRVADGLRKYGGDAGLRDALAGHVASHGHGPSVGAGNGGGPGKYDVASAQNFGAFDATKAAAAKKNIQDILTKAVDPATGKPYLDLSKTPTAADITNASEAYLHAQGFYNGPMNDGKMGTGVRTAWQAWAKAHGADIDVNGKFDDKTLAALTTASTTVLAELNKPKTPTEPEVNPNLHPAFVKTTILPVTRMILTSVPVDPTEMPKVAALAQTPVGAEIDRSDLSSDLAKKAKKIEHFLDTVNGGKFKGQYQRTIGMHSAEDALLADYLNGSATSGLDSKGKPTSVYYQFTGSPADRAAFDTALKEIVAKQKLLDASGDLNAQGQAIAADNNVKPGEVELPTAHGPGSRPHHNPLKSFFSHIGHGLKEFGEGAAHVGETIYYGQPEGLYSTFTLIPGHAPSLPPQPNLNGYSGNRGPYGSISMTTVSYGSTKRFSADPNFISDHNTEWLQKGMDAYKLGKSQHDVNNFTHSMQKFDPEGAAYFGIGYTMQHQASDPKFAEKVRQQNLKRLNLTRGSAADLTGADAPLY